MPELSEKVYPDGTVVKLRDDAAREQIISNRVKVTGSIPVDLTFTSGKAEFNKSNIGATWIIAALSWGGDDAYCVSIKNYVNGIYTIHNVKNPSFSGTASVVFVYITY